MSPPMDGCCGTTSGTAVWYMAKLAPVKTLLRHTEDMVEDEDEDEAKHTFTDQKLKKSKVI